MPVSFVHWSVGDVHDVGDPSFLWEEDGCDVFAPPGDSEVSLVLEEVAECGCDGIRKKRPLDQVLEPELSAEPAPVLPPCSCFLDGGLPWEPPSSCGRSSFTRRLLPLAVPSPLLLASSPPLPKEELAEGGRAPLPLDPLDPLDPDADTGTMRICTSPAPVPTDTGTSISMVRCSAAIATVVNCCNFFSS
jgi:hypothetical protein